MNLAMAYTYQYQVRWHRRPIVSWKRYAGWTSPDTDRIQDRDLKDRELLRDLVPSPYRSLTRPAGRACKSWGRWDRVRTPAVLVAHRSGPGMRQNVACITCRLRAVSTEADGTIRLFPWARQITYAHPSRGKRPVQRGGRGQRDTLAHRPGCKTASWCTVTGPVASRT